MNATSSRSHAIFSMILSQTKQIEMDDKAETREEVIFASNLRLSNLRLSIASNLRL